MGFDPLRGPYLALLLFASLQLYVVRSAAWRAQLRRILPRFDRALVLLHFIF